MLPAGASEGNGNSRKPAGSNYERSISGKEFNRPEMAVGITSDQQRMTEQYERGNP